MALPFTSATAITTSDTVGIPPTVGVYVGGAGDLKVKMAGAGALAAGVTFKAVPVGTVLAISIAQVFATGTTATNLLALR